MADAEEFVHVRLKGTTAVPARVTQVAYDTIWKAKGFVIVDDDEAALAASPEPAADTPGGDKPVTTKKGA